MIQRFSPAIEGAEGEYIVFEPTDKGFRAGTVCNTGIVGSFEYEYDNDFSFDENLQAMVEEYNDYTHLEV